MKIGDLIKWKINKKLKSIPPEGRGIIIEIWDIPMWRRLKKGSDIKEYVIITQKPATHKNKQFLLLESECEVLSEY